MSMVAGPPASQSMMTALALRRFGRLLLRRPRLALQAQQLRQRQAEQAGRADLEEVAAMEAFAVGPETRRHDRSSPP